MAQAHQMVAAPPTHNGTVDGFRNENTVWHLAQAGKMDEFHAKYDAALAKVRGELGRTYTLIINGERVPGQDGAFDDTNPANTKEVLGHFAKASKDDVAKAVDAADVAFREWSALSPKQRAAVLRKAGDLLRQAKYEFAAWMTLENGKPRVESMNDVDEAIDFLTYYPMFYEAQDGFARLMGKPFPNETCVSLMKPYGVWAVISPFNFPVAITIGMTAGALVTGNTVVLKPASDTPLVAYRFVELLEAAGVPKGAINYVTGAGGTAGQALLDSDTVKGVVFTGSRSVGLKGIETSARKGGRPFIAEMGGKNPIIVTAKANLDEAVEGVARSAFGFSGQKCSACSRVYVHESIKDEFTKRLLAWVAKNANVGNPEQRDTYMGPVVNKKAYDDFLAYVAKAKAEGGTILTGGASAAQGDLAGGHYVQPTIVDGLADDAWITQNELFVPLASLYTYRDLDDAVRRANDVPYGLTAGIFSRDDAEVQRFMDTVQAGVLYANRKSGGSTAAIVAGQSFVGWKASGTSGRGAGGPWYLLQFLREQSQTRCD